MKIMSDFLKKYGLAIFAAITIFFSWGNLPGFYIPQRVLMQSITFPLICIYLAMLAKNANVKIRIYLLITIIIFVVFSNIIFLSFINQQGQLSDVPIGIEAATIYLSQGKNPYTENYYGTVVEKAAPYYAGLMKARGQSYYLPLEIFPYLPAIFLLSVPYLLLFPFASFALLALVVLTIILLAGIFSIRNKKNMEAFLLIAFFNPFIFLPILLAHSIDFLIIALMLIFTIFFIKNRQLLAGTALGLLFATKAYTMLIIPFFLWYLFKEKKLETIKYAMVSFAIIMIPFVLWDSTSLIHDTVLSAIGSGKDSLSIYFNEFPGFLPLLKSLGIISNSESWISIPLVAASLLVIFLIFARQQKLTIEKTLFFSAIAATTALFFSKMMIPNYMSFPMGLILALILANFIKEDSIAQIQTAFS